MPACLERLFSFSKMHFGNYRLKNSVKSDPHLPVMAAAAPPEPEPEPPKADINQPSPPDQPPCDTTLSSLVVQVVLHAVQSHHCMSPKALSLSVASYLRDGCGLSVKLYLDVPSSVRGTTSIPPGWMDGLIVTSGCSDEPDVWIDFNFRSKFIVARPTSTYLNFLTVAVPVVFVGTRQELELAVDNVVFRQQQCLKASGLHTPPWREAHSVRQMYAACQQSPSSHELGRCLMNVVENYDHMRDSMRDCLPVVSSHSYIFTAMAVRSALAAQCGVAYLIHRLCCSHHHKHHCRHKSLSPASSFQISDAVSISDDGVDEGESSCSGSSSCVSGGEGSISNKDYSDMEVLEEYAFDKVDPESSTSSPEHQRSGLSILLSRTTSVRATSPCQQRAPSLPASLLNALQQFS